MRCVVQRVSKGKVSIKNETIGEIEKGLVTLLGVGHDDSSDDVNYLVDKVLNLRVFEDEEGKMNLSLLDINGDLLVVSQFTLFADCRRGRRPSFVDAAPPKLAEKLYEEFIRKALQSGLRVETGQFGAEMNLEIHNDGPVTILLDSKKNF